MRTIFITLALAGLLHGADKPWHAVLDEAGSTWQERWDNMIPKAAEMSPDERVEFFSHILVTDAADVKESHRETYKRVQDILLNTPGHAKYFGNQLKKYPEHTSREMYFQYMENLPSVETVGVLGELLMDDRSRPELAEDESNLEEYAFAYPNCDFAAQKLQKMLANPPVPKDSYYNFIRDLPTWREWFEDVKAGRQTFRFVGDPVDYTLRGPSKRGAVEPGPRNRKRNYETPSHGESAEPQAPPAKPRFLAYLIGVAFVLAGYLIYRRGKRKAA